MSNRGNDSNKLLKVSQGVTGGGDGFSQTSIGLTRTDGPARPVTPAKGGAKAGRGEKVGLTKTDGPVRPMTKADKNKC